MPKNREFRGRLRESELFFGNLSLKSSKEIDILSKVMMNPGKQADPDGKTALFWGILA